MTTSDLTTPPETTGADPRRLRPLDLSTSPGGTTGRAGIGATRESRPGLHRRSAVAPVPRAKNTPLAGSQRRYSRPASHIPIRTGPGWAVHVERVSCLDCGPEASSDQLEPRGSSSQGQRPQGWDLRQASEQASGRPQSGPGPGRDRSCQ